MKNLKESNIKCLEKYTSNVINYKIVILATIVHNKWNILYLQKIFCIWHLKYTSKNDSNEQLLHTVYFMSQCFET